MSYSDPRSAQRRAARAVDRLRGELFADVAGIRLDVFDAMRSPLLLAGGHALLSGRGRGTFIRGLPLALRRSAYMARQIWRSEHGANSGGSPSDAEHDVLMVPRQMGHLADQLPLAHQLLKRGVRVGFVADVEDVRSRILAAGFDVFGLKGRAFDSLGAADRFAAVMRRATKILLRHPLDEDRRVAARLRPAFGQVAWYNLAHVISCAVGLVRVVHDVRPRLLLVGNPYTMEGRIGGMVASALDLRSACLEHGSVFPGDPRWDHCPLDAVLAWGEESAAALRACGVPQERVRVTGSARLDAAGTQRSKKDIEILVATSGAGDMVDTTTHRAFVRDLATATRRLGRDVRIVVKLHPKDQPEFYDLPELRGRVDVTRGDPGTTIYDYLSRSRLLVTVSSTCAVEAMALGVPVVGWVPNGPFPFQDVAFLNEELVHRAQGAAQLSEALQDLLGVGASEEKMTRVGRFAQRYFANVGNALATNTSAVMDLLGRSGPKPQGLEGRP